MHIDVSAPVTPRDCDKDWHASPLFKFIRQNPNTSSQSYS